jgi:hypothetical protein
MKKFSCEYNHRGKRYVMYFKAQNFDHAQETLDQGYLSNRVDLFDFADKYSDEEKKLRLRDARFNGELGQVIFSVGV